MGRLGDTSLRVSLPLGDRPAVGCKGPRFRKRDAGAMPDGRVQADRWADCPAAGRAGLERFPKNNAVAAVPWGRVLLW